MRLLSGSFYQGAHLCPAQFDTYLADFPHLEAAEAAGCKGPITESEIWEALKLVGRDKTLGLDGLSYELYLGSCPFLSPCWH